MLHFLLFRHGMDASSLQSFTSTTFITPETNKYHNPSNWRYSWLQKVLHGVDGEEWTAFSEVVGHLILSVESIQGIDNSKLAVIDCQPSSNKCAESVRLSRPIGRVRAGWWNLDIVKGWHEGGRNVDADSLN
jgi:hypothetical protein